jgi:putative SOS response-associated peptidase YedK
MCGRFTLTQSPSAIASSLHLPDLLTFTPRYNIAPTQPVMVVRMAPDRDEPELTYLIWGLIPAWAKDQKIGAKLINARAETLSEKPSFRSAFKRRRCLVIADGFYEWRKLSSSKLSNDKPSSSKSSSSKSSSSKQPMYFSLDQHQPFSFAGLWEHWQSADGGEIESCTIITTEANDLMRPTHDRMPVILEPQEYERWLDPQISGDRLQSLLRPYSADMNVYPVSAKVNSPRNEVSDCITPIASLDSEAIAASVAPVQNSK